MSRLLPGRGATDEEVRFWREWLRTGGFSWPDDYERRLDPLAQVEDSELLACLKRLGHETVTLLDVGAGPVTSVGYEGPGCRLEVVAIDPLARRYDELLAEAGVAPPVRTRPGKAARVHRLFPAGSFDLVYARNSLDHARRPLDAIRRMVAVLRPGGYLVLRHRRNEGEAEGYTGMHRWNFDEVDGRLVLWRRRRDRVVDIDSELGPAVSLTCRREYEFVVASGRRDA